MLKSKSNKLIAAILFAFGIALTVGGEVAMAREKVVPADRQAVQYSYAPIVKEALPAVVNVYARFRTKEMGRNPFFEDPLFRHFFGDSFGVPRERMESSLGSGVIVDPSGLVVTNYHVIDGAQHGEIKVALPNKEEYHATIVLADKKTDLAVLKMNANGKKFPYLNIANSDLIEVGDIVLAMGNPFGVGQTVTNGIVSAVARTGIGKGDAQYFIQTDAAINPGNSGGPLVDVNGEIVGINTAIFSKSGGSLGIGFAIPSNMVRLVVSSAKRGHVVQRPWFGGKVDTVNEAIQEGLQLPRASGAFISSLSEKSPAKRAGLQVGDVVMAVNGHEIPDGRAFQYQFSINGVGGTADLTIWRKGQQLHKRVELIAAPEIPPRNETRLQGQNPFAGAVVANLSPALAEEMSMSDQSGVVVLDVGRRSYARRIGLTDKDIILEINQVEIDSVKTLIDALQQDARYWRFTIKRGGNILTVTLGG